MRLSETERDTWADTVALARTLPPANTVYREADEGPPASVKTRQAIFCGVKFDKALDFWMDICYDNTVVSWTGVVVFVST